MDSAASSFSTRPAGIGTGQDLRVSLALLLLWTLYAIWRQWGHWGEDLSALYIAGHLWQSGRPDLIYAAPPGFFGGAAEDWRPVMDGLGIGADQVSFPYIYPPLWAVLLGPLTTLTGPQGFCDAVTLVQMPMLAASVLMTSRLMRPATMPLSVWTLAGVLALMFSVPSFIALWHNQPTVTVIFLVLLAFVCLAEDRPLAAGAALALAAAIKLTPAAFALIFLIDRQYRAVAAFVVIGGALALLSLALAGPDLHMAFLGILHSVKGLSLLNAFNLSLVSALISAGSALGLSAPVDHGAANVVFTDLPPLLTAVLSGLAGLLVAVLLALLRARPPRRRRGIGLFALSIILPLFGPLGWQHYLLLPLFLLPSLFGLMPWRRAVLVVLPVAVASCRLTLAVIGGLPWPVANYVWFATAAWLAVLAALYLAALHRG